MKQNAPAILSRGVSTHAVFVFTCCLHSKTFCSRSARRVAFSSAILASISRLETPNKPSVNSLNCSKGFAAACFTAVYEVVASLFIVVIQSV